MLNLIALSAAIASPNSTYPTQEVLLAFEQACGDLVAPVAASSRAEANGWSELKIDKPDSEMAATIGIMKAGATFPSRAISEVHILTRLIAGRPLFLMYYRKKLVANAPISANDSNECQLFDFNTDLSLSRDDAEKWMDHPPHLYTVGANGMWEMDWSPGRTQSQSTLTIAYFPTSSGYVRRSIQISASDNPTLRAAAR